MFSISSRSHHIGRLCFFQNVTGYTPGISDRTGRRLEDFGSTGRAVERNSDESQITGNQMEADQTEENTAKKDPVQENPVKEYPAKEDPD